MTPRSFSEQAAPFSPHRKPHAHYSKLTPGELTRLREFRGLLNAAAVDEPTLLSSSDLKRFVNDACLCRYLRARKVRICISQSPRTAGRDCPYSACQGSITTRRAHFLGLLPRLFT